MFRYYEAVLWRAELCEDKALVLLPCCQAESCWGISNVMLMLLFPSSNASSLKEEFWIKLSLSCSKEWKERRKKSHPAGCEAARAVPGGSAGLVAMWDPAWAHSQWELQTFGSLRASHHTEPSCWALSRPRRRLAAPGTSFINFRGYF